jgi:hypothetical protein
VRAGGCILQLRQARAQQYIPAILVSLNKGWQHRWFYLRNDDGRLPSFSQRVVTAAGSNWRYGAPHDRQKNLKPLLAALQELRDGGLTIAGVVAAIHRWRVLPPDGAAAAAFGDDAGGRLGGFADVLGPPPCR